MWDSHTFGTWQAVSESDGRLVSAFEWEYPPKTPGYSLHLAARLPAEDYDGVRYDNPTHKLTIVWFAKTPDSLATAVNEAVNAIVPGAEWTFRAAGATLSLSTSVIDAYPSEPYSSAVDGRPGTAVTFSITTTPGWRGPETTIVPQGAGYMPYAYKVSGVLGSMPCPMRVSHTYDQATSKQAIGYRHDADWNLSGWDYAGVADAAAFGGQCAQKVMTGTMATISAPPTIDSNIYRGWYMAAVRIKQPDATPADTTYRALVTTSGSGVAESSTFLTSPVPATVQNLYEVVYLGPFPIPAGPIPDVSTGSGYAPESISAQQTTETSTYTFIGASDRYGQTFHLSQGERLTGFTVKTGATLCDVNAAVYATAGGKPVGSPLRSAIFLASWMTPNSEYRFNLDYVASAAGTYCVLVWPITTSDTFTLRYNSEGGYASGTAVHVKKKDAYWYEADLGPAGTLNVVNNVALSTDLYFKLYTRLAMGFSTTVAIQAANAGGGTVSLDTVALVPFDEWSALAALDCVANEGVMLDVPGDAPDEITAYLTKTDGSIGPVSQSLVDWQGLALVWPGTSVFVVTGQTPGDAAPAGGDLKLTYRPTYQTPYGG